MPDRKTPYTIADEKETLRDFLDYLRDSVIIKAADLPKEDAARALVPSGTSLLWLIKHLATVEIWWVQYLFAGLDVKVPEDDLEASDTVESGLFTKNGG